MQYVYGYSQPIWLARATRLVLHTPHLSAYEADETSAAPATLYSLVISRKGFRGLTRLLQARTCIPFDCSRRLVGDRRLRTAAPGIHILERHSEDDIRLLIFNGLSIGPSGIWYPNNQPLEHHCHSTSMRQMGQYPDNIHLRNVVSLTIYQA